MDVARHYPMPPPRIATRDSDGDSTFRASDDTTIAESEGIPSTPRQPPAYGDEGAPPQYEEDLDPSDVKAKRAIRKTLCIRLMTSIFITVLVSLIVAAVVAKMHDSPAESSRNSDQSANNQTTDGGSFTMTSGDEATSASAQAVMAVTMSASLDTNATQAKYAPQTTATDTAPRATAKVTPVTVDCEGVAFTNATLVTEAAPAATGSPLGGTRRRRRVTNEVEPDVVGMSIYAVEGCLLTRTTYKEEASGGTTYKCAMMCPDKKQASVQARHVVTDEWGACG